MSSTSEEVKRFYNNISDSYEALRFKSGYQQQVAKRELSFVIARIPLGSSVLEIGPGTGRFTLELVKVTEQLTIVDISPKMIEQLRKKLTLHNVRTYVMPLEQISSLPEIGTFDRVVCMRVLPHLENIPSSLSLIRSLLNPDGRAIVDLWNAQSFPVLARKLRGSHSKVHTVYYRYNQMLAVIQQAGFSVVDSFGWGYPRLGNWPLDKPLDALCRRFAYSVVFELK